MKPTQWDNYCFWALLAFAATATASVALQNLLLVAVALALWILRDRKGWMSRLPQSFAWATLFFLLTFLFSSALGVNPGASFKTVHKYLIYLALFPLGALGYGLSRKERLLEVFTAGTAVCAVWGITKHFLGWEDRIRSFSGHWMVFGGLLMLGCLTALHWISRNPRKPLPWVLLGLNGWALLLTQTRGAWMGLVAGAVFWGWKVNRKALLIGILAVALSYVFWPAALKQRVHSFGEFPTDINNSNTERIYIWEAGLRIIRDYPVFGIGQSNMEETYPKYRLPKATEPFVGHLHDNFLQVAAQNGLVGLAAYLAWISAYFWMALRFRGPDEAAQRFNWTLTCLFLATLVWGLTEYTFSYQFMNVQAFLLGLQVPVSDPLKST